MRQFARRQEVFIVADDDVDRPDQRAFGDALAEAMAVRGMTQRELGEALGLKQPTISAWIAGTVSTITPSLVFETERALRLPPGRLSRILGYVPMSAAKVSASFERVVMDDPLLEAHEKRGLLAMYGEFTKGRRRRAGRARKTN